MKPFGLKDYHEGFLTEVKPFLEALAQEEPALFADTLFLSFLGARICYAATRPLNLFAERRFRDQEELVSFLMRLKASGHASVFAHSPLVVRKDLSTEARARLFPFLFKAWWAGEALCLNLRHFAEAYEDEAFRRLLSASLAASRDWPRFRAFKIEFSAEGPKVSETTLGALIEGPWPEGEGLWAPREAYVIEVSPEKTAPFGWLAVIVEGFSRLFSHQFVRHTWLNFNQRSHRYTAVDQFVCPPSFDDEARKIYEDQIKEGLSAYEGLVKKGIKKEDARFVTPQGAATTLLATGPRFVWEDFVAKRNHPKAQWEIRALAAGLALVLKRLNP